jgi:HTH-like domain
MAKKTRRKIDATLKAKIAVREAVSVAELAQRYGSTPIRFYAWKKQLLAGCARLWCMGRPEQRGEGPELEKLHAEIGQLIVGRDFLASRSGRWASRTAGHGSIVRTAPWPSARRAGSSGWRVRASTGRPRLQAMSKLFTAWPFLGSRRMARLLGDDGRAVNRKRVQRLMRLIAIAALAQTAQ